MKTKLFNRLFVTLPLLWCGSCFTNTALAEDAPSLDEKQATEITKPNRIEPAPHMSMLADLSQELSPETEILNLKAAEDSFVAYYREKSGAQLHGGIIFFPDDYTHPDWPIIIKPLRTGLSDYGWSTLAISLPQPITKAEPIRTLPVLKAIKTTPSTDMVETPLEQKEAPSSTVISPVESVKQTKQSSDTDKRIMQRGITAIQALQQKGMKRFILVGVGTGATWATTLALSLQTQTDVKLLIINATQSQDLSAPKLLDLIPDLKITTLDIYGENQSNAVNHQKNNAKSRLNQAQRNKLNNYHQSRLPLKSNTIQGQEWLIRHTRGLLETYIVNVEKEALPLPSLPSPPAVNQQPGAPLPNTQQTNPI